MRKLFPITMALVVVATLLSCTNDSDDTTVYQPAERLEKSQVLIDNGLSAYDSIGLLHNVLLDTYFKENHTSGTIQQINDTIDLLMHYAPGTNSFGTSSCATIAADILLDPIASFEAAIPDSGLSTAAVAGLRSLLTSLSTSAKVDYPLLLTTYDQSVANDVTLTNRDKEVLHTTTSLAICSYYYGEERKDKDWETSVGNVVAAFRGALSGSEPAIRLTLVTGIAQYSATE